MHISSVLSVQSEEYSEKDILITDSQIKDDDEINRAADHLVSQIIQSKFLLGLFVKRFLDKNEQVISIGYNPIKGLIYHSSFSGSERKAFAFWHRVSRANNVRRTLEQSISLTKRTISSDELDFVGRFVMFSNLIYIFTLIVIITIPCLFIFI